MRLSPLPVIAMIAGTAHAQDADPPSLAFPLDCDLGVTCYIEDYVDNDPAPGKLADFACGINTRDGHKGTDIALLSFDTIEEGTTVTAAAPGQVLRTRDGMADDRLMRGVTSQNACGNAVLIDHGGGWRTLYCHLREGSLAVSQGDQVQEGDPIAMVGLSGQTNHPHLHLQVLHDDKVIDPFRHDAAETCDMPEATLWKDTPAYTETGMVTAGFSDHMPTLETVQDGSARAQNGAPDRPLVVYAYLGYAQDGDQLTISATGPEGEIFRREMVMQDPAKAQFQAFGRNPPPGGWPSGEYLGEALVTRSGEVIAHRFAHVTVQP